MPVTVIAKIEPKNDAFTGLIDADQVIAGTAPITGTGILNAGSITSGFGNINNGSSTITTTGLISGGSLDIDDVVINGATIGHTDDTDLLTVADGLLTVTGEISVTTLDIGGTNVTSTAAELNILDGLARGSIIYGNASGATATLTKGNADQVLTSDGTDIAWADASGGGASALNDLSDVSYSSGDLTISSLDKITFANSANADMLVAATAHNVAGKTLTISAGDTTAGTTNNIAGGALTLQGGQGKGTGDGGAIIFQVANANPMGGSSLNSLATALTINQDRSLAVASTIELGHASDTTIARASSGDVNIEGNIIYRAGGTDVAIADGGTGASDSNAWLNSRITTNADGSLNYDATGATAVNHDSLAGFSSNEHIDWTSSSGSSIHSSNIPTLNQDTTGSAATVTAASQSAITSLGTLTTLTVDDILLNGKVIQVTGDTDDTFTITTGANGETTLETVDNAAAAGHLNIEPDGHVEFDNCAVGFDLLTPTYNASDTDVSFITGNKQFVTFGSGNITDLNLIFPETSGNFVLLVKQDGTGSRTITNYKAWDLVNSDAADGSATVKFAGGSNPTLTTDANHVDILSFFWDADNQIAYGVATLDFQF